MNCMFLRRRYITSREISLALKTAGNATYCYMMIDSEKIITKGTYTVNTRDTIIFGIYGTRANAGWVKIDGETVAETTNDRQYLEYSWVIPQSVNAISVSMSFLAGVSRGYGQITVTTS